MNFRHIRSKILSISSYFWVEQSNLGLRIVKSERGMFALLLGRQNHKGSVSNILASEFMHLLANENDWGEFD